MVSILSRDGVKNVRVFYGRIFHRESVILKCEKCDLDVGSWSPDYVVFYNAISSKFLFNDFNRTVHEPTCIIGLERYFPPGMSVSVMHVPQQENIIIDLDPDDDVTVRSGSRSSVNVVEGSHEVRNIGDCATTSADVELQENVDNSYATIDTSFNDFSEVDRIVEDIIRDLSV